MYVIVVDEKSHPQRFYYKFSARIAVWGSKILDLWYGKKFTYRIEEINDGN